MGGWVGRTLQARTLLTGMVALFGGASLLLACIGLYGVVSYTADLRLREFGIRMALGAGTGHVRGLVLRHAGKLALWGSTLGLTLAWPVGRALQSLLFGVTRGRRNFVDAGASNLDFGRAARRLWSRGKSC